MTKVISIDPETDPRWCGFIAGHPGATIFHHPSWLRSLELTYDYTPRCLALAEGDEITGILPLLEIRSWLTGRRAVCLPFSDACLPLTRDPHGLDMLIQHCSSLLARSRWRYLEIHGSVNHRLLEPVTRFKHHRIALGPDSGTLLGNFRRNHQQNIEKAKKYGVTIERSLEQPAMSEFIRLNALTRKKLGVPPPPDRFFLSVYEELILKNRGLVTLAKLGRKTIAAAVFLMFKDTLYYKYAASDESFLRYCPNHLIVWDSVKWACEHGYAMFDFGRTDLDGAGLLQYKRGWGAEESDLTYCRLSAAGEPRAASTTSVMLGHVRPLLKKAPMPVLKMIGKSLYSHAE